MPGNKQSGMKEEPAENTKKRGNMKMKTELQKQLFALQILISGISCQTDSGNSERRYYWNPHAGVAEVRREFARDHSQEAEAF